MHFNCREDIIQLTPEWKGERFPDGRPKVPDQVLERIRRITLEEAWGYLWSQGYKYQFQGGFQQTNPGKTMVFITQEGYSTFTVNGVKYTM